MRKPTREEVYAIVCNIENAELYTATDRIMALFEEEPTAPKWEIELAANLSGHREIREIQDFTREKLQELADDASEMTTKDLHKKWGLE